MIKPVAFARARRLQWSGGVSARYGALGLALGLVPMVGRAVTPLNTVQPSTSITYAVDVEDTFEDLGTIHMFAGNFAPGGFLANGAILPISQYSALYEQIGTTFGGDGQATFGLPNLTGRTPIGTGGGPGLSSYPLGATAGAAQVTLGLSQMPVSVGGQGQSFTTIQPTLAVNYMIAVDGVFPSPNVVVAGAAGAITPDIGADGEPFIGQVFLTTAATPPNGLMPCNGQLLPINQYTALFSILGTTYGGNGQTTFALPDLRGRAVVGAGTGLGLTSRTIGESFGTENTTLVTANLPVSPGSDLPFSNMQPSAVLHYIIALQGIYPSQGTGGAFGADEPILGEIILFTGNFAPEGWAFCDGQIMPIQQNTALFSLLGTLYGGNGTTNFALPNLDGRVAVGEDGGSSWPLGLETGTETLTLNGSQIPALPEPTSLSLLALGAVALWGRRVK